MQNAKLDPIRKRNMIYREIESKSSGRIHEYENLFCGWNKINISQICYDIQILRCLRLCTLASCTHTVQCTQFCILSSDVPLWRTDLNKYSCFIFKIKSKTKKKKQKIRGCLRRHRKHYSIPAADTRFDKLWNKCWSCVQCRRLYAYTEQWKLGQVILWLTSETWIRLSVTQWTELRRKW